MSYNISPSLSDLLHSVWHSSGNKFSILKVELSDKVSLYDSSSLSLYPLNGLVHIRWTQ